MSFPTLVYRCPGPHVRAGGTYAYQAVNSEAELVFAVSAGWCLTLPDAIAGKVIAQEPKDDAPPTRAELEQKAAELGIKADGRWSDKRLNDEIAKRL